MQYAVGFARPDRWRQAAWVDAARPWHAVEAIRSPDELDGEVELAVCGAIVQVWGRHDWDRLAAGRTACPVCLRQTAPATDGAATEGPGDPGGPGVRPIPPRSAEPPADRHLRVVS